MKRKNISKESSVPKLKGKQKLRLSPEEREKTKYFEKPVSASQTILLIATVLAIITLVIILVTVFLFDDNGIIFGQNVISYVLYGLIMVLIINFIAIVFMQITSNKGMPTYDEYRKSLNRIEFIKKRARFPNLNHYDKLYKNYKPKPPVKNLTLKNFCESFRAYNAKELKLYFSEEEIRRFVTGLGVSKTMILQGMSGTGKTSLAVAFGKFIGVPSTVVPIQPMWKERSDLLGYFNEFTGKFNETMILQKIYQAIYADEVFIVVLDEVNIARVEYYFAEFLSLLELPPSSNRKLAIAVTSAPEDPLKMKRGNLELPNNIWFLGTANNDDSTFAISDKVYDRAMVMSLDRRSDSFSFSGEVKEIHVPYSQFSKLMDDAKRSNKMSPEVFEKIMEFDDYLIHTFHITFGNRILMQMNNYVPIYIACGGSELEAIDGVLAKKVLRKLEAKNPIFVKTKSAELLNKIDQIFGQDQMKNCVVFINNLVELL